MSELKNRFGDLVRTYRGPRGEERFVNPDEPGNCAELVKDCLSCFTPWTTRCLMPKMFDPILGEISGLTTQDLKDEHLAEANRIHALTHPPCYQLLVKALGFQSPDERLSMPRFFFHRNDQPGPRSRLRQAPAFDAEKLTNIRGELAASALRRKKSAPGLLRVRVDGEERARLDPRQDEIIRFLISRDAELLEVIAEDSQGEVLLATLLLNYDMDLNELPGSPREIVLEGGQKILIGILVAPQNSEARMIDVTYRANSLAGATALPRGLVQSFTALWTRSGRLAPISLTVLTLILISLGLIELRHYRLRGNRLPQSNASWGSETSGTVSVVSAGAPAVTRDAGNSTGNASANGARPAGPATVNGKSPETHRARRSQPIPPNTVAAASASPFPGIADPERSTGTSEQTRALKHVGPGLLLPAIKKVFVQPLGNTAESKLVAKRMVQALRNSGRFDVVPAQDDAEAVLKISVGARPRASHVFVHALLVNVNGEVLWPLKRGNSYSGSPETAAKNIVRKLLRDIERLQR